GAPLQWGSTGQYVASGQPLLFGSLTADSAVNFLNPINLQGGGTLARTVDVIDDPAVSTDQARLAGVVSGTDSDDSLVKTGAGMLTLSGANTYLGQTVVNAGVLVAAGDPALGSTAPTSLDTYVSAGGALALDGGITSGETVYVAGAGPDGSGALKNLSGNNTLTGAVFVNTAAAAATIGSDAGTLTLNGAVNMQVSNLAVTGAGDVVINGAVTGMSLGNGFAPGLSEGRLLGPVLNTAAANPGGLLTNAGATGATIMGEKGATGTVAGTNAAQALHAWGGNETWVYTGQVFSGTGVFSFAEDIDDGVTVTIDGVPVLVNGSLTTITNSATANGLTSVQTVTTGANTGTPTLNFGSGPFGTGWHTVEVRLFNGTGGAGAANNAASHWGTGSPSGVMGFGFSAAGDTGFDGNNFVIPKDPGDASLFRVPAQANGLTKSGTGTLTLGSNLNSYAGGTTVSGGTVASARPGALGTGTVTLDGGTLSAGAPAAAATTAVSGFGTDGAGWTLNGGASVAGDVATLTNGGGNEARSLFANTKVPTAGDFTARFTYTAGGNRAADGFGFVMQN